MRHSALGTRHSAHVRFGPIALMGLGLLGESQAAGQDYTGEEWAILTAINEVDAGLERVYVDGEQFYYELPATLHTPDEIIEGAFAWIYDGQELFSDAPPDLGPHEFSVPDLVLTGMDPDPDTYFGVGIATRVDLFGRRWLLDYVDYDIAQEMREAYDREEAAVFGSEAGDRAIAAWESPVDAGEVYRLTPMSWSKYVCDGAMARLDLDGEELDAISAPVVPLGRKVLLLATGSCSGTMVDDEWMLTAAHCVKEAALSQAWCSMENLDENSTGSFEAECSTWSTRVTSTEWEEAYPDDGPAYSDYAVVRLLTPPSGVGYMFVSGAADSVIEEEPDYLRGYPRYDYDCASTAVTNDSLTTVDQFYLGGSYEDLHGRDQHLAEGMVDTISSNMVYYATSTARGMSGGPHYCCPTGFCAEYQAITAVNAYAWDSGDCTGSSNPYSCSGGSSSGPKGSAIRDWVIANTP